MMLVVVVEGGSGSHHEDIAKAHHAHVWRDAVVDGPS
jgi:hypothetical protein